MTNSFKKIYNGTPGTVNATLYTVPASTVTIIKNIVLCNTTSSAATITLKFGGKTIISAYSVAANDTVTIDLAIVMNTSDLIEGLQGTASAINVYISGIESM